VPDVIIRKAGSGMKRTWQRRALAGAAALALSVGVVVGTSTGAAADEYPSWQDVQNAKANQAAAQAQVNRIEALISQLQGEVAAAQAEAEKRGQEFQDATLKFDLADLRYNQLEAQADESRVKAEAATAQAGRLAAQLYRTGSGGITTNLLLTSGREASDELLSDLSSMSKLLERNTAIYEQATVARNTAKSLADQASVAKAERERLREAAQVALDAAIKASQVAQDKLAAEQQHIETLNAQLAALKDTTAQTVAGYEAGVAERARIAAEEARKAAEAGGSYVSSSGWALPISGWITDTYGPRSCSGCAPVHQGVDLAAPLGSVIHAAAAGTVTYRGPMGTYGNLVIITHADGYETYYAHTGSYLVGYGQWVSAGEPIARVGMTGLTTGPHLHFETRRWGSSFNPIPFMADRGVRLGR